jgi:hypothetical protein
MIRAPSDNRGLVWLASYPKSGNTWLRVFLYHLVRIQNGAPREPDEINKLDRVSMYEGRLAAMYSHFVGKPIEQANVPEVAQVRQMVQRAIVERMDQAVLIKTHNALASVAGHPLINPSITVGAVYMVRDPRDVLLSLAHHLGISIDDTIDVMNAPGFSTANTKDGPFEMWGTWSEHVASWTAKPQETVLVVRYEDLLADPVGKFVEITAHLRQAVPRETIAAAAEASTFAELSAAEREHPFRETSEMADRFFREGKAGGWKERLSNDQSRRIVDVHWEQMRRVGYTLE